MGPKDHMQKNSDLTCCPCCPWGERQNFEGMGKAAVHRVKRLRTREDNISVIIYLILDFMA